VKKGVVEKSEAPGQAPVLLPVPADPTVSYSVAFRVGSQDDPPGKEGLASLTASLMAEGATRVHSYQQILALLFPMAATYDVRVDVEQVTFTGRTHEDNVDAYSKLLLEALLTPAFTEADFARLRERTLTTLEKTLRYSSDEDLGKATLYNAVFAGTPYGHLPLGTVEGLRAITLDDVRAFYAAHFTRQAVTLGLGGGFDEALLAGLTAALQQLPSGLPSTVPPPSPKALSGRDVVIVEKPGPATALSFGFPIALTRGSRDFYALWLANSWLGEHRNSASHLYQVIRETRGLNYGDYSYIEWFPEGGQRDMPPPNVPRRRQLFEVWIRPVPSAAAPFALRAALRELEALVAHGMSEADFALTKEFVGKYALHFAETTSARLGWAMDDRAYGVPPPGHLAGFREVVPTLTRDEVNRAIKKYLDPKNLVIAAVTQDGRALADALASGRPTPITYETPKPDLVTKEDAVIAAYPLDIRADRVRIVPVSETFVR
jgi:zinc protease